MAKIETVEIEGVECELATDTKPNGTVVPRQCVVCKKANMGIRQRTGTGGSNETQHIQCPRCDATAHRQVNVVSNMVLLDSDFQGVHSGRR